MANARVASAFRQWRTTTTRLAAASTVSFASTVQVRLLKSQRLGMGRRVLHAWRRLTTVRYSRQKQCLILLRALIKRRQRVEMQVCLCLCARRL